MRDIRDVYQGYFEDGDSWGPAHYQPMLESLDYEIAVQVDDSNYQGDSRLLLRDGARYGVLIFGWGSCSGCDSLQACGSYEEVEALRDALAQSIRWFESADEAAEYFRSKDWSTEFLSREETQQFADNALRALEAKQ